MWVHRGEILGWGALADLIMLAVVVGILARRAWVSVSALALERRGYDQNHAARQRATDLIADGYHGFISGHTHHPELGAIASGFYANSGSCTSVVEGIGGRFGLPPAYVRNQQVCWVEVDGEQTQLVSARVELPGATKMERFVARGRNPHSDTPVCVAWPGATKMERFVARGRNPHSDTPVCVASWPAGPDWPAPDKKASRKKPGPADPQAPVPQPASRTRRPAGPSEPDNPSQAS